MSFAMRHLTQSEQTLLQNSYAVIQPALVEVMTVFFDKVLTDFPSMRAMFGQANQQIHVRRFAQVFDILVTASDRLPKFAPHITALGEQHHGYGVHPSHYIAFGESLLWVFEQYVGHMNFTADVRRVWVRFFEIIFALLVPNYASEPS